MFNVKNIYCKYNYLIWLFILLAITVVVYGPNTQGFFQQDEWSTFGRMLQIKNINDLFSYLFSPRTGHYLPFSGIYIFVLFKSFGLNYPFYVINSIFLHLIVITLVYVFSKNILKNNFLSLIIASMFALSVTHNQSTTWVIADIPTHFATILGLISLISFYTFTKSNNKNYFLLSIILLFISLFFKEITIGLFFTLPLMFYLYGKEWLIKKHFYPIIVLLAGVLFFVFRSYLNIISTSGKDVVGLNLQNVNQIILNLIIFPVSTFVQSIFPVSYLLKFGKRIINILPLSETLIGSPNTTKYNQTIEQTVLPILCVLIFSVLIYLLIHFRNQNQNNKVTKTIMFGLFFSLINSFIYILSPNRTGLITLMDSRNLYFPSIGAFIFFVLVLNNIFKKNIYIISIFVILFLSFNVNLLNIEISNLNKAGATRKNIINQIIAYYPSLPFKSLVYTISDTSYYGLPPEDKIMPFQSGFGQLLLVIYSIKEPERASLLNDNYLWGITEQGYKEIGNYGFGYVRDYNVFKKLYIENNLEPQNVFAFKWIKNSNMLKDITPEIHNEINTLK